MAAGAVAGCGTGDTRVDPADLELRDLLGISPEVASHWDADARASARRLIAAGLHDAAEPAQVDLASGATLDVRLGQALAALDAKRVASGGDALGMVRVALATHTVTAAPAPQASAALGGAPVPAQEVWLAEQWDQQGLTHLAGRGLDLMSALALDAGHTTGGIVVVPVAHLAVIAGYVPAADAATPARLVINPVVIAALEPTELTTTDAPATAAGGSSTPAARVAAAIKHGGVTLPSASGPGVAQAVGGNPYSFYGSYEECAAAQHNRCQTCLAAGNCKPITGGTTDGNAECTTLDANNGKGYYELCIDLSLAITSVNNCTAGKAPSCARNATAADSLSTLAANDDFLTDSSCSDALDACLAEIFGAPSGNFPNPIGVDGGVMPPSQDPPRDVSPSCGHACSSNTTVSPTCDCKGGNCGNSLTCSSGCASSNDQSGCGADGSSCDSGSDGSGGSCDSSSTTTSSSDTGSCSSDNSGDSCSGGSSSSSGSSCSSGDSCGGNSTDSCGSSSSSSSSGCGSSGSDSCGSSSSSSGCGSSGGDSCGSSSGSSGCSVTKKEPSAVLAVAISASWGIMPVPIAAFVRRRSRKKKQREQAQAAREEGIQ